VEGIWIGLKNGAAAFGGMISDAFKAAASNIGSKIWEGFKSLFKWPEFKMPDWLKNFSFPSLKTPDWLKNFAWPTFKIPDWLEKLKIPTPSWLQDFKDWIKKLTDWAPFGSGGGKGVIAETWDKIFSSKGGIVYAAGGWNPRGTDTVPAMLTPGELVIPRNDVDRLSNFLSRMEASPAQASQVMSPSVDRNINITLKVGEKQLADVLLSLNRAGFRTA
jgi:hypothetical protein